jgi:hypothetical protein
MSSPEPARSPHAPPAGIQGNGAGAHGSPPGTTTPRPPLPAYLANTARLAANMAPSRGGDGTGATREGCALLPHQHRCRKPPPRPRPAADPQATSDCMNDFAGPCDAAVSEGIQRLPPFLVSAILLAWRLTRERRSGLRPRQNLRLGADDPRGSPEMTSRRGKRSCKLRSILSATWAITVPARMRSRGRLE